MSEGHRLSTPLRLIQRLRAEERKLQACLAERASYAGADPNEGETLRLRARHRAMRDVLQWIEEEELRVASDAVRRAMEAE